jgi:hypothetical protein
MSLIAWMLWLTILYRIARHGLVIQAFGITIVL